MTDNSHDEINDDNRIDFVLSSDDDDDKKEEEDNECWTYNINDTTNHYGHSDDDNDSNNDKFIDKKDG